MKNKSKIAMLACSLMLLNNLNFVFAETKEKILTTSEINKIVENKDNIYGSPNRYWNEETGEFIIPDGYTKIDDAAFVGKDVFGVLENMYNGKKANENSLIKSKKLKSIKIPISVTHIGEGVCAGMMYLEKINLPETLKYIGAYSFSETNIKELEWPKSVSTIEIGMFIGSKLEKIKIPNMVTHICEAAFANTNLHELSLPDSVVFLGKSVFSGCKNLKQISLPEKINKIENDLFFRSNISQVVMLNNITEIGQSSFAISKIASLKLSTNVKSIDKLAFICCEDLESLEMPGVTSLGDYVFSNCSKLNKLVVSSEFFKSKEISAKAFEAFETTSFGKPINKFYNMPSASVKENSVDVFVTDGISGLNISEIKAQNKWIRSIQSLNQEPESSSNSRYLPNTGLANTKNLAVFVLALSLGIFCVLNKKQKI